MTIYCHNVKRYFDWAKGKINRLKVIALQRILREKRGEEQAMNRPGLGDIYFVYGKPERLNTKGRLVENEEIVHLVKEMNAGIGDEKNIWRR